MTQPTKTPRVLIAGVGNIFLGDDAFGVEVARKLRERHLPAEVQIIDFGIRGIDLAFALLEPYDAVILVDAMPRGGPPGTLYVLQPEMDNNEPIETTIEMHNLDPVQVIRVATSMGAPPQHVYVIGCEPTPLSDPAEFQDGLTEPVQNSLEKAADLSVRLALQVLSKTEHFGNRNDHHSPVFG